MTTDYEVERSRAVEPLFYRAPAPGDMTPREYQYAGVEYALARDHAIIGDAPGLGKTCQAILISNAIEAQRTLVICPASLRLNWVREIGMWSVLPATDGPRALVYPVLASRDGVSNMHHYVVISYDLLRNDAILDALLDIQWDHMILDECHYLKDPKGNARTIPICAPDCLPAVVGRITALSGTLLPNQPDECYNIMRLLDWGAIDQMSLERFRDKYYGYGGGMIRGPVWDAEKQATVYKLHWSDNVRNVPRNLEDLGTRLRAHLMIRRMKPQVLHELPEKQWHPFPLEPDAKIRKALKHPGWEAAEKLYEMDPDSFSKGMPVDGAIATARRLLGEAKAPSVAKYIEELLAEGIEKVVVCAWHLSVLKYLRERLDKYGLRYMDGSTSPNAKQNAVDDFQDAPEVRIILGQMKPLGLGWNLMAAQDVVFAEFDWVPGNNEQLLDRVHRFGQTGEYVIGHMPVVPDTLDERILGTAIEKDINIYKVLDGC